MSREIDLEAIAREAAKAYAEQTWIKTRYHENCAIRSIEALADNSMGILSFIAFTKSGRALTVLITPERKTVSVHITDTSWASGHFEYDERGKLRVTVPFSADSDD